MSEEDGDVMAVPPQWVVIDGVILRPAVTEDEAAYAEIIVNASALL